MLFDTGSPGAPDRLATYEHLFLSGQQVIETREGSGSTAAQAKRLKPKSCRHRNNRFLALDSSSDLESARSAKRRSTSGHRDPLTR
jgi:hypothetical protein